MYIDIDNFKAYNDVYGFEQGDKVIINAAKFKTFHMTIPLSVI